MMDDDTRKRIQTESSTRPVAGPKPHEHYYQVAVSSMTSIRFCSLCGKSWRLTAAQRHFQAATQWQEILEPE